MDPNYLNTIKERSVLGLATAMASRGYDQEIIKKACLMYAGKGGFLEKRAHVNCCIAAKALERVGQYRQEFAAMTR